MVDGIEHQFDPGRDSRLVALGVFQLLPGLCSRLIEEVKLSGGAKKLEAKKFKLSPTAFHEEGTIPVFICLQ